MARIPVDVMAKITVRVPRGQQGYWEIIRDLARRQDTFTLREVDMASNARKDTVRDYLKRLARAGYVKETGETTVTGSKLYRLDRDAGPVAPSLRRDGTESTQGLGQDHMWRAMKMLGEFSVRDLAVAARTETVSVSVETAKTYIARLQRHGYLACVVEGIGPRPSTWRLKPSMNTGPLAPMVQRTKLVFDPNLKKVMEPEGGIHETD